MTAASPAPISTAKYRSRLGDASPAARHAVVRAAVQAVAAGTGPMIDAP